MGTGWGGEFLNFFYFDLNSLFSVNFPFRQMLATRRLPIKLDIMCLSHLERCLTRSKSYL